MAGKFIQHKLPWKHQDVVDAIDERLADLKKFDQEFLGVKTDAKSIRQRLTLQSTGEYPDSDDDDPTVDAAHKKSVDLVEEHKRLMREVPAKATELQEMQEEADEKKVIMDKILSDGSPDSINVAEVMKMKIPHDKMMIIVQAATAHYGSLDFLRSIGSEHRQLLLSKEAEIADYKRAERARSGGESDDVGEEVIPSTYPDPDSTQGRKAREFADLQSACSRADHKAKELERQVADLEKRLADEQEASAGAQKSLHRQLAEKEDALRGKEAALEQRDLQLAASNTTVARLEGEAGKLSDKVAELEQGVIAKDDLMEELEDARSEVEKLKEQVEKMLPDVTSKSRLEEELAAEREQLEILKNENEGLENQLRGKGELLEACNKARDSAQRLADQLQAELAQKNVELEGAVSMRDKTAELLHSTTNSERKYRSDYNHQLKLCEATYNELVKEQKRVKAQDEKIRDLEDSVQSKDDEVQGLQGSLRLRDEEIRGLHDSVKSKEDEIQSLQGLIGSKDEEIRVLQGSVRSKEDEAQGLRATIESTEESLRLANEESGQLTNQIRDKDEKLQSQHEAVGELRANLADVGRQQADAELDLRFVIRLSNLSIRDVDVRLPEWTPLLRSLRASDPVEVTPEGMSRQTWAVLPSWPGRETSEWAGTGTFELSCLHSSLDGLLFELYGHGMAEGDFPCNKCLQAICILSALVERQGPTKVSSLVLVLEKLEARLRGLEGTSWYQGMVMLGLRYLASLVRSRVPGGDVPGLSAVEGGLDGMMRQADKCLAVIRHVSDGLCSSGDIETIEASQGLRLTSREGRVLVLLAGPECVGKLFLLADPEKRTVRAVSFHRLDSQIRLSKACELVNSAVIEAPAGQSDVELDLTAAEADWIQENL